MSINLDSLLEQGNGTTLDDLVSAPVPTDMPINNRSTANNMAAHAALLVDPEGVVDTYQNIMGEFAGNTGSPTMDKIVEEANVRENNLSMEQMVEILGDEWTPIDKKVEYASLWRTGVVQPVQERSPEELVQVNQLEKEGLSDNVEADDTRWDLAPYLAEVNQYNNEIQRMINEAEVENNPNMLSAAKDFLEIVVPFMEGANVAEIQTNLRQSMEQGDMNSLATGVFKSLTLLGESKEEIRDTLARVPIESRLEVAQKIYDMVIASEGSITGAKNSLVLMNNLRDFLVEGHYTTSDRVIDDMASILDAVGVGATIRGIKGGIKSAANAAKFQRRSPTSVGENINATNGASANTLIKAAADDETGEVAKVVYGTSREDAIVNNVGPEIGLADDSVRYKPLVDDDQFDPDYQVVSDVAGTKGNIQFSPAEKQSKLNAVINDFTNPDVTGLIARKEMTTIKAVDDGVNVRTVFAPAEGGFAKAKDAITQVKLATRKYGILDEEITLMKRGKDGNYKVIDPNSKEANLKGNYVVGINHTTPYDPSDTIAWSVTDVKGSFLGIPLNIFDKLPVYTKGKGGSITQHLIPSQSYIDPLLTRSASVAADQTARSVDSMIKIANDYATEYKGLQKHQKKLIDNYILEANDKSLKFDPAKLRADGWTTEMLSTYRKFKSVQDTLYVLENIDLVRQSRRKGFEMLQTADGQDQFLVKPISNSIVGNLKVTKVYDPEVGMIRTITGKERTELYKNGGTIAIARTPVVVGEQSIPYVMVKQNGSTYTRGLRESDKLLKYRDGHFTIYYKNPVFITKEVKNADGSTYTRAIATSDTIKSAEAHLERLRTTDPDGVYNMRSDRVGEELEELLWNARVNAGRTAQRTRGETLADVSDKPTDLGFRHIATPEESLVRSIKSIANRINMKEYLDTAKTRFSNQYKDFLPIDPNTHARVWPDSVKDLKKPDLGGDMFSYHDAVSTYRYIDQMENGFVNMLDDTSKNFFKAIAETSGKKGFTWLEKGARSAEDVSPTAYARKKAFRLLLAASPVRQILVQASQGIPIILSTNPTFLTKLPFQMMFTRYLDRGGDVESFFKGMGNKLTGFTVEEAKALEKAYKASGISSAVSAHSLIRDDLIQLVNRGPVQKTKSLIGKPLDYAQKLGFEAGENMLMRSVWLNEYDRLKKSGKPMTSENLALIHARVRDLTLNMNKAGELAYNENMFSVAAQFLQAQHKAIAQILVGNRSLTRRDRIALGTGYLTVYGTGYGFLLDTIMDYIPEADNETRDIIAGGLTNLALNRTLSTLYGEEVNTDFSSSMRLLELPNVYELWTGLMELNPQTIAEGSPSLGLVLGDNAKVTNLIKSLARVWTVPEDDGTAKDVGRNFLEMFSGASAIFKARYAMRRGYSISTKGEVVDPNVNEVEAMMKTAGFQTVDEMLSYETNEDLYFNSKGFRDDVKYVLDETARRLARDGVSEQEEEYVIRMLREANRVWENNPTAMEVVRTEIRRRAKSGDHIIVNRLLDQAGMVTEEQWMETLRKAPLTDDQKDELKKIYNFMKEPE
jgi:hypothetical protein